MSYVVPGRNFHSSNYRLDFISDMLHIDQADGQAVTPSVSERHVRIRFFHGYLTPALVFIAFIIADLTVRVEAIIVQVIRNPTDVVGTTNTKWVFYRTSPFSNDIRVE
jgi:hypothetical protein